MAGCGWVGFSSDSRFLAEACGMAGCGLAMVAVAFGCDTVICSAVASAGVAVAVNSAGLSIGFAVVIRF